MSLYGINAYTSNYNSMYSGLYNKNRNSFGTNTADLLDLAKRVDYVRSKNFRTDTLEQIKKALNSSESASSSSDNPQKVSETAAALSKASGNLLKDAGDFSDTEKTVSAVKNFVDSYNKALDAIQDSDNTSILERGVSMVNTTKAYARTLAKAGIQIGNDNRLTVKEEAVKTADPSSLKALFNGSYSYATKIADKASYVGRAAALQSQLTYNSNGKSSNIWDTYNQFFSNLFNSKV